MPDGSIHELRREKLATHGVDKIAYSSCQDQKRDLCAKLCNQTKAIVYSVRAQLSGSWKDQANSVRVQIRPEQC